MATPQTGFDENARRATGELATMLRRTAQRARDNLDEVEDPKAKALFETTAEVTLGLVTAFEHYESRSEPAWK